MNRITITRSRTVSGIAVAVLLSLGTLTPLALPVPSSAAARYFPSIVLNHYTGVKLGETLKVTGKGFPPGKTVVLYQCNQGVLDAPSGVFTKKTCDLSNTPRVRTSRTGTFATTFKVKVTKVDAQKAKIISTHTRILFGLYDSWSHANFSASAKAPFLTSSPTEAWLNPQTFTLTGLLIPAVASGSADLAAECNDNVLVGDTKACGSPVPVTVGKGGKATGKLPVVMGDVGDGTCGTGTADEVCYIVLANVTSTGAITPVAAEAIDFYEAAGTSHVVKVTGGGRLLASAAKTTLTDNQVSITCVTKGKTPASATSLTVENGTTRAKAPHPVGIAANLAFSNCTGPLGGVTVTVAGEPYPINANSATSSGATATTISDIDVTVSMVACSFTVTGSAPGDYSNTTHTVAMTPKPKPAGLTKAVLSVSAVSGCAGLVKNGDRPTFTASYKLSPATLAIKSAG